MREIKFRAWRRWDEEMVYDDICVCMSFNDDGTINDCSSIPMQFTGLRDKNGKEIYEGDVLAYEGDEHRCYRVVWHQRQCRFGMVRLENVLTLDDGVAYGIRVIGNIHENPELLGRDT